MDESIIIQAIKKLSPKNQIRNPVIFVVYVCSLLMTVFTMHTMTSHNTEHFSDLLNITIWLWFTVLSANFSEAIAEKQIKKQANFLRSSKKDVLAKKLKKPVYGTHYKQVPASSLQKNDYVLVEANDLIPGDGTIVEGVASVNESAITGESAPVIRESNSEHDTVTGGTQVLSDWIIVRLNTDPGDMFLDHMVSMIEGAKRHKTPNEIALTILLVALTLVFLLVTTALLPFSAFSITATESGTIVKITTLIALLVCLIPTTIASLLSTISVAAMSRMMKANVIATSGKAVEAAGDVDLLLLDKTGTVTLGNRQAKAFHPIHPYDKKQLAQIAHLASLADDTPEGHSITILAAQLFNLPDENLQQLGATTVPFTAHTQMSGININHRQIRKGALRAMHEHILNLGGVFPEKMIQLAEDIARHGSTPLIISDGPIVLGVVELKDIIKLTIKKRFAELRQMGITTIMITGDNPLTTAAIAAEAGVDDFIAEAKPAAKLKLIRDYQSQGHLVAMAGDGINDAPALAQADVALAMSLGTQAAKEASNMVDLDSDPTKLIEVVTIGKEMLITRGSLTTFSLANDIAKYFSIIPAAFSSTYPQLAALNFMRLGSPLSATLSTVIFNALIIAFLIPLALRGIKYRPTTSAALLRRHLLIYGVGGIITPFIGIKLINGLLVWLS